MNLDEQLAVNCQNLFVRVLVQAIEDARTDPQARRWLLKNQDWYFRICEFASVDGKKIRDLIYKHYWGATTHDERGTRDAAREDRSGQGEDIRGTTTSGETSAPADADEGD